MSFHILYKFIFNSIESGLSGTVTVMLFLTAIDINANTIVALDYSFNRAYPDCVLYLFVTKKFVQSKGFVLGQNNSTVML